MDAPEPCRRRFVTTFEAGAVIIGLGACATVISARRVPLPRQYTTASDGTDVAVKLAAGGGTPRAPSTVLEDAVGVSRQHALGGHA